MHLNWLYLVSFMAWRCACVEPQTRCYSPCGGGEQRVFCIGLLLNPPSFMAASNQLFLLLDKSFIIDNTCCFCGVIVLDDEIRISTHGPKSLFDHQTHYCKARASPGVMFLHVYTNGFKWLWFSSSCSDVKRFVWMYFSNSRLLRLSALRLYVSWVRIFTHKCAQKLMISKNVWSSIKSFCLFLTFSCIIVCERVC